MISYAVTLSDALTPITLISGVGLLLLAMHDSPLQLHH